MPASSTCQDPVDEKATAVKQHRLSKWLDALRSGSIQVPTSTEELDRTLWQRFMYDGWSGALSRSTYDLCRFYDLGPEAERAVRDVIRSYKVLEITDAALFCKAARNEPREFYTDESSFADVISQLQPPMPTKYTTFPPELDMAIIRAMIGSVEASSPFRPTEHLEQHINDMFTDVKIPPHITKIMLPVEAELPMSTPDQLRDCVSKRLVPISNQLYAAAKFPYRWFCKGDRTLLAALRDLRDPDGHIVSPIWVTTDCILARIDPTTQEVAKPVEIAAFITLKNLEELNLAGQAVHVVRPRENVLPSSGETDRKNSPWHSEDSYAKALIAQMGANFWFTGASVGCFWDGHFMVMAQVIENGQQLDIHFSRVVAAGSRFSPYLQQITAQTLHASVADHIKTATETAERRQEAQKLKLHDIETAQKELLAAVTKTEDRTEGTEVALCCAKERGDAENEVEECKKMQLATSVAAAKMANEAKIAKEKYEEAKATVDDLQDGRCYVSDIYRGLNSYGLFTSIGILAARRLPQRHARRKPSVSLVAHPFYRVSERESGVLHDEHPLPYVDCGRNILGGGLHGIVCDGEFHDVHGTTIPVVVKMPRLTRKMAELNEAAEAMEHELQVYKALHRIQGSVIPRLYGCGYVDDWYSGRSIPALVLENAGEKNLTSLDISTLTDDEKLDIIDVLGAFHRKGWVHGDIAERNILYSIDTNGRKKFRLCDLALAEQWECREDTRDETFNLFEILYPYEEEEEEEEDDDPVWKKYRCYLD